MSGVGPGTEPVHHDVDAVPREARGIQGLHAGIVTRTAANTVDFAAMVCVLAVGYAAWFATRFLIRGPQFSAPKPSFGALIVCGGAVLFVYFTASWATTGRTYGDHLLGLRVVDSRGERLRWRAAVVRAALCVGFPIGLYWCVVSPTSRSLQDSLLRTAVIYDWATVAPVQVPPLVPGADGAVARPRPTVGTSPAHPAAAPAQRSSSPGEGTRPSPT